MRNPPRRTPPRGSAPRGGNPRPERHLWFGLIGAPRRVVEPIYDLLDGRPLADLPLGQAAPLLSTFSALQWLRTGVILLLLVGPAIAANSLPAGYLFLGRTIMYTLMFITPFYNIVVALVTSAARRMATRDPATPVSRHPGILSGLLAAPYVGAVVALLAAAGVAA